MTPPRIRKQIYELTLDDFNQFSVWESALDEEDVEGQDEATMRPFEPGPPVDPGAGSFAVRTEFTLADGTKMEGLLTVSGVGDKDLGTMQPAIITPGGQVDFWCGMFEPNREMMDKSYVKLGKKAKEVFPIHFKSTVEIDGGPYEGVIEGFYQIINYISDGPEKVRKFK